MDSFEMAIGAPLFLFQNAHEIKNKMGKAISVIEISIQFPSDFGLVLKETSLNKRSSY